MGTTSMASALKAYWLPLILFAASIYFQLFVIPSYFPPSHYDVLGVKRYSSVEEVADAYEKLSSKWNSGIEVPCTNDFIKIQYAFELLTNPLWKRNYDIFGIDEQLDIIEKIKGQCAEKSYSSINLPLLEASSDFGDHAENIITSEEFGSIFKDIKAWLVQLYSRESSNCAKFSDKWKKIAALLDGVANTGIVELGDFQLSTYFAERKPMGQSFFRNGIPSLVAFPLGCRDAHCLIRYEGELLVDPVTDWFATTILSLPRIRYYSKESLGQNFLAKSSPHKVKVILFSRTGERATPFLRQAAMNYWSHASFAFVLWREEESSFWWNAFEVESAPAIVFLKDPGVKPVVYHGSVNNSWFLNIMEQNKHQELPQLRSVTSMELGCDARGYSRGGSDIMTWYCVILAGRQSLELNKMRETMRRVQEILLSDGDELYTADKDQSLLPAATALKKKRLTFTWVDGEVQKQYCFSYLDPQTSYETCGPRREPIDVPRLLIIRYQRNASDDDINIERKPKSIFDVLQKELDPVSHLVARYNGSGEIPQIIQWISQIIRDGDTRDLPSFRTKSPDLVPEDANPIWSRGAESVLSSGRGMKQRILSIVNRTHDRLADPRIGPFLLLGALMSFGGIWLRRSQSSVPSQSNQPSYEEEVRKKPKNRTRTASTRNRHPSTTDTEPKDAYQMPFSDSD